jgi:FkbM family methyltransferase
MLTIDGHTFDENLLNENLFKEPGWVIDAGCRGFNFAYELLIKGRNVYAIDIEDLRVPQFDFLDNRIVFKQAALTNYTGKTECYLFGNGTGNFIKGINGVPGHSEDRPVQTITVPAITLRGIYNEIGTDIDLLKLDIEGSEYQVLDSSFEPIPKQITVETHEHCHPDQHNAYWPEIFERLCKHYNATLHIREWPQYKFMDCLFIRKDIL